ncbi:hypothetical protein BpHYR1_010768 [Brachionus plicatilis]|uniref:Uncharacterized protein n=1 Tax=Brachionus plicatilis TaxID=10195 RepID=A0A3M7PGA5_BRAPC|nr:hypothetical protein BpHYR1_010768 [Brachionus plicatilis]
MYVLRSFFKIANYRNNVSDPLIMILTFKILIINLKSVSGPNLKNLVIETTFQIFSIINYLTCYVKSQKKV